MGDQIQVIITSREILRRKDLMDIVVEVRTKIIINKEAIAINTIRQIIRIHIVKVEVAAQADLHPHHTHAHLLLENLIGKNNLKLNKTYL